MPNYDAVRFDPPAPVAQVVIRNPERGNTVSGVSMLLDSGADVTLVPQSAVSVLGVLPAADQIYELMGFNGTISPPSPSLPSWAGRPPFVSSSRRITARSPDVKRHLRWSSTYAFDHNLKDYRDTIPHLFRTSALIILSNGSKNVMGTSSSSYTRQVALILPVAWSVDWHSEALDIF